LFAPDGEANAYAGCALLSQPLNTVDVSATGLHFALSVASLFGYLLLLGNDELESFLNILLRNPQHPMSLPPQLLRTLENLRDQAKDAVWALSSCLCQQTPKIKINGRTCEFMGDFKTWMNSGVWGGWTGRGRGLGRYNRTLT